jgi:hypothetical protein
VHVEAGIFELYIDLMCEFKPQQVENFIKTNEGYRLEETLAVRSFNLKLIDGSLFVACTFIFNNFFSGLFKE